MIFRECISTNNQIILQGSVSLNIRSLYDKQNSGFLNGKQNSGFLYDKNWQ